MFLEASSSCWSLRRFLCATSDSSSLSLSDSACADVNNTRMRSTTERHLYTFLNCSGLGVSVFMMPQPKRVTPATRADVFSQSPTFAISRGEDKGQC